MKPIFYLVIPAIVFCTSCKNETGMADAYGNFEAVEHIVSSESPGKILAFGPDEGSRVKIGEIVVVQDTSQLSLKKEQLESGRASLRAGMRTLDARLQAEQVQLNNLEREKRRLDKLVEGGAATTKEQDDLAGQVEHVKAMLAAIESEKAALTSERQTLEIQIKQVRDQIRKCYVDNPVDGLILNKYREEGEFAAVAQPLYKVANMDELILRAYVSGDQLASISLGSEVGVAIDSEGELIRLKGAISWISSQAEFTPKIIQTREERVNLVYAVKIRVKNDGSLKIGMPAELYFQ